jgi:hypothetical protein
LSDLKIDYSELLGRWASRSTKGRRRRARISPGGVARLAGIVLALAVLPFVLLIRGAVVSHLWWGLGTWPSLFFAALSSLCLLAAYGWVAGRTLARGAKARRRFGLLFARAASAVGVAYLVYALVFVASANVASDEVRAEYRALHPFLRLGSSALILVDPSAVITDASRTLDDYARMGLPAREASLHFRQRDGYVHAIDLRTGGRSAARNLVVRLAFRVLGFQVLRHGGTGDHLHVSLPLRR